MERNLQSKKLSLVCDLMDFVAARCESTDCEGQVCIDCPSLEVMRVLAYLGDSIVNTDNHPPPPDPC